MEVNALFGVVLRERRVHYHNCVQFCTVQEPVYVTQGSASQMDSQAGRCFYTLVDYAIGQQ